MVTSELAGPVAAVSGAALLGASLFGQKRARWQALIGCALVVLAAWVDADPVMGLGGVAAALAVWPRGRREARRCGPAAATEDGRKLP